MGLPMELDLLNVNVEIFLANEGKAFKGKIAFYGRDELLLVLDTDYHGEDEDGVIVIQRSAIGYIKIE